MKREVMDLSQEVPLETMPRQVAVDLVPEVLEVVLTMRRKMRVDMAPVEFLTGGGVSHGVPANTSGLGQEIGKGNLTTKVGRRILDLLGALRQSLEGRDHGVRAQPVKGQQRSTDRLW